MPDYKSAIKHLEEKHSRLIERGYVDISKSFSRHINRLFPDSPVMVDGNLVNAAINWTDMSALTGVDRDVFRTVNAYIATTTQMEEYLNLGKILKGMYFNIDGETLEDML